MKQIQTVTWLPIWQPPKAQGIYHIAREDGSVGSAFYDTEIGKFVIPGTEMDESAEFWAELLKHPVYAV